MHYAKNYFLVVIISIITLTMILIHAAVLLQKHLQSQIFWKLHQLES